MGRKKQITVALLEVVFVAFSCASPTVQTESTRVQGGYVESAQCKVPRLSAKHFGSSFDRLIFCALLFFFRTPTSARTGSLLLSSSFKGTYFRTTHCPPRSELIATPVNNALANPWLYMRILFVTVFLSSSTLMEWWLRVLRCKKTSHWFETSCNSQTQRKRNTCISAQQYGYVR